MKLISTTVIQKKRKTLTSRATNWDSFREELDQRLDLKIRLKTPDEIQAVTKGLIEAIREAAQIATPDPKNETQQEITYPLEIREKNRRTEKGTTDMAQQSNAVCQERLQQNQ